MINGRQNMNIRTLSSWFEDILYMSISKIHSIDIIDQKINMQFYRPNKMRFVPNWRRRNYFSLRLFWRFLQWILPCNWSPDKQQEFVEPSQSHRDFGTHHRRNLYLFNGDIRQETIDDQSKKFILQILLEK